jgi:hypothetical protein
MIRIFKFLRALNGWNTIACALCRMEDLMNKFGIPCNLNS